MKNRQWNVIAGLAGLLTISYVAGVFVLIGLGRLEGAFLKDGVLPVVTAALGYLAALIQSSANAPPPPAPPSAPMV